MREIYTQAYITVERTIVNNQLRFVKKKSYMKLYKHKIEYSTQTFSLADIYDVSYKLFSDGTAFLYLHTHSGIVSFHVEASPDDFIAELLKLKKRT